MRERALAAEIALTAKRLRDLRRRKPRAMDQTKVLRRKLRDLRTKRAQEQAGKLIIQGTVNSEGQTLEATVSLHHNANCLSSTHSTKVGEFEHRVEARLGEYMILAARKEGYARMSKRVGGQGTKSVRFELLPLGVRGKFTAVEGKEGRVEFKDSKSGAKFKVPVGSLLKHGQPFSGPAEFEAAVVDVTSRHGVETMPPLAGRTVAGALVPMQSLGAVFTALKDASDKSELQLRPGGEGIEVSLPTRAPLPPSPPSIWHYDEKRGQWEQTLQPLEFNGFELPLPHPDEEVSKMREVTEQGLAKQREEESKIIQDGRQAVNAHREEQNLEKICTCGFHGKAVIMPLVRKHHNLPLSDPPKRIFAATFASSEGNTNLLFPYLTQSEEEESAKVASAHPEVVLSQHLAEVAMVLGNPRTLDTSSLYVRDTRFYRTEARKALPALHALSDWMIENARVGDSTIDDDAVCTDQTAFKLTALESFANYWARSSTELSPAPTLVELREALDDCGGVVPEALLHVAAIQARRDEVARVRKQLASRDPYRTAKFRQVEKALEECDGNIQLAVEKLMADKCVRLQAEKLRVREALYKEMPMAHPTSREVERAINAAQELRKGTTEAAAQRRELAEKANKEASELRAKLAETEGAKGKEAKEAAAKLAAELATAEEAAQAAQADLDKAEAEVARAAAPGSVAQLLAAEPAVQERAKQVYTTWSDTLKDANQTHMLNWEITEPGWDNADVAQQSPSDATTATEGLSYSDEFFPATPKIICPVGSSSMVLGAFDDGIFASRATAVGVRYRGIEYAEDVQPDGTFSLVAMVDSQFELKTQRSDGTESFAFGPFYAASPGRVTHLGLLEPPRDGLGTLGEDDPRGVEIVLPALEFPPQSLPLSMSSPVDKWIGTWRHLDTNSFFHKLFPQISGMFEIKEFFEGEDPEISIRLGDFQSRVLLRGPHLLLAKSHRNDENVEFCMLLQGQDLMYIGPEKDLPQWYHKTFPVQPPEHDPVHLERSNRARRVASPFNRGEKCTCFGEDEFDEEEGCYDLF